MKRLRGSSLSLTELKDLDLYSLSGITQDSRAVKDGFLFAAFPGEMSDGRDYIEDAIGKGASVILTDPSVSALNGADFIFADNPRRDFAHIAADYYKVQPKHIVAVTGTNGKSSVVDFVTQMWARLGYRSRSMGTLTGARTTPDPVTLHEKLRDYSDDGITHLAMEASSHGLAQYRLDGVRVSVAAFTNLSRDHLDYHKSMGDYLQAKARLFSEVLPEDGIAVLNADVPEFRVLKDICKTRKIKIICYGRDGDDIKLISAEILGMQQKLNIEVFGKKHDIRLPLIGDFQVSNALCALGCILGIDREGLDTPSLLENLAPVRGRLQHVSDGQRHVYVDYAHTPDALETVLKTLRPFAKGRVICVFGCGGDRDKGKRPLMGKVVSEHSDIAILTDDNPRSENPAEIRAQVRSGMAGDVQEFDDRALAIRAGVGMLGEGDLLLVAGKGHEQGQEFKNNTFAFDDVEEAKKALSLNIKSNA
ncbi:MAG: UDP-N-acetylmuramoyl-L-alanyl-D-glutamate--2,6-diaminopimelate ligase [Alphaproteobacteria bacterium]|nr:UDP-N-acetylmuramoyl-L-alanyl-D-glutamate--2,6-diaminopimelate ligase [Alphaproteobacteria bacterium]